MISVCFLIRFVVFCFYPLFIHGIGLNLIFLMNLLHSSCFDNKYKRASVLRFLFELIQSHFLLHI